MDTLVLNRELYSAGEAARLLEMPLRTLRRWLDGYETSASAYEPVIRPTRTGSDAVTWGEFLEAGFLRGYRKQDVSLQQLRPFIALWRERRKTLYPLAVLQPQVDTVGHDLMLELKQLQDEVGLDEDLALVHGISGQLAWKEAMAAFLSKVEFDPAGPARSFHPLGKQNPVAMNPELAFGVPQVRGIRTETIAEAVASGDPLRVVQQDYRLSYQEIEAAIQWELRLQRVGRLAA